MKQQRSARRTAAAAKSCLAPAVAALLASALIPASALAQTASCEALKSLKLPGDTTISMAQTTTGGAIGYSLFLGSLKADLSKVPTFCRVAGVTKPGPGSQVNWEVWMPATTWNGRYEQLGGGLINGYINYDGLAQMAAMGYAAATTDGGSSGDLKDFLSNADRRLDFSYRSYPATYLNAQALIQAFYGKGANKKYWLGCSEGGREGLLMAQRYPDYFDGIVAGAPVTAPLRLWIGNNIYLDQIFTKPGAALMAEQIKLVHSASTAACASPATGVVDDPRKCAWDVASLQCSDPNKASNACLSSAQVTAMKKILGANAGPHNPRTGRQIFSGVNPFSGLDGLLPGSDGTDSHIQMLGAFYNGKMDWDWQSFNYDSDQKALDASTFAANHNVVNPDMSAFKAHGGKLILWHGWEDSWIFPWDTVNYYEAVIRANASPSDQKLLDAAYPNPEYPLDADAPAAAPASVSNEAKAAYERSIAATNQFAQLYMTPGTGHCGLQNSSGAESFIGGGDFLKEYGGMSKAIEAWVEGGAPAQELTIVKNEGNDPAKPAKWTTKLCPYPKSLTYSGSGSQLSAESYICK